MNLKTIVTTAIVFFANNGAKWFVLSDMVLSAARIIYMVCKKVNYV